MRKNGLRTLGLVLLLGVLLTISGTAGAESTITNTGAVGLWPSISGSMIAFSTSEWLIGQDLNGDGDTGDSVIRYYDTSNGQVTNTGAEGYDPSISGSVIAFSTREQWIGQDLNGDGDTDDYVIRYYGISTGRVTNTGAVGLWPSISGSVIAFDAWEPYVGQDLNGDGDMVDHLISYYDTSTGQTTNTGAEGQTLSVSGSVIAFSTREQWIGQDLNGDGDFGDPVIRSYDTSTGQVTNTGAVGGTPSISGSVIALVTGEVWIGQDLNGDGDTDDYVIRYCDTSTGQITNTGAEGYEPSISGSVIAFYTIEWLIGQDLNGDGDTDDILIRYYDISTGHVTNTGAEGYPKPSISGSVIAFATDERRILQDLNGDGDTSDYVLRYVNIPETPPDTDISIIKTMVEQFADDVSIDNQGVAEALYAFLDQAEAMMDNDNQEAAARTITGFINFVEAQSGRHLTTEAAQTLIDMASGLQ